MRKTLLLFFTVLLLGACVEDTFVGADGFNGKPSNLKYMEIKNAREAKTIISGTPTISVGNLIPFYEIVSGFDKAGTQLDDSFMKFVTISNPEPIEWNVSNGDNNNSGINYDLSKAGAITIADGHKFTVGSYYFTVKVTTKVKEQALSTTFDKVFHLQVEPLLPTNIVYQLKSQNLVYGDPSSKTNAPQIPVGNKDVSFSLADNSDKLAIDAATGIISLQPSYEYTGREIIRPTIDVTSNISGETVSFANSLIVIITNAPEEMPRETIYFFYPTLETPGAFPTGGDGFTVNVVAKGVSQRIWGLRTNSAAIALVPPAERPASNKKQVILETLTHNAKAFTQPTSAWCITTTQDLSIYNLGYELKFGYYYMPGFQSYMADGRTPTDLEVYISTDYNGGPIQTTGDNWTGNGTWTKINQDISCRISLGKAPDGKSDGTDLGEAFIGTPYPGDQKGEDPDGRKDLNRNVYGKWVKCSYDITQYKECKSFTVAFKVNSYFYGELANTVAVPGRGGAYFLSDFHYMAKEVKP